MEPMEKTDNLDRSSTGTNNTAMDGGLDSSVTDQYLTFIVAEEEYGVDILCVQEIRGWESATPLQIGRAHV